VDTELAVLGVVSLVIWALILVVTLKYVILLMRADNKGEGGTLALMALARRTLAKPSGKRSAAVFFLGVIGAALFYGDGIITPAISVLSAVEGLKDAPGMAGRVDNWILSAVVTRYARSQHVQPARNGNIYCQLLPLDRPGNVGATAGEKTVIARMLFLMQWKNRKY
jgi:K+ transporter